MTMSRLEARQMLTNLGVARWETNPPSAGVITWLDEDGNAIARGNYHVILSWGPGIQYTMGWAIAAYPTMGIPFVAQDVAGEPGFVEQAGRSPEELQEEAYQRADEIAARMGASFSYQAATLLLAVTDFTHEVPSAAPEPEAAAAPAKPRAKPKAKAKVKPKPVAAKAKPKVKAKVKAKPVAAKAKPKVKAKPAAAKKAKPKAAAKAVSKGKRPARKSR